MTAETPDVPNPADVPNRGRRKRAIALVIAAFALLGLAYGVYWFIAVRYVESTDDAYVGGNVVRITPQVSGTVVAIGADDTQLVAAGQTLVRLDAADARVALDRAEAELAKAVREVRGLFATATQLEANVAVRRTELDRAKVDLARRERLAGSGAVSAEELQHARDTLQAVKASLLEAEQRLRATRARIDGTTLRTHPRVLAGAAHLREAYLMYARMELPAPVSGLVAKRSVQLGQRVAPGAALMAIVPLDEVWVDANFKESQLARMRIGQPATLTADLYGDRVAYHGMVAGLGAGTGAAFAVLPAQNATGNWIKIVQRVPVRIALDPQEVAAHPLQVGLSMLVQIDTRDDSGAVLPRATAPAPVYETHVFDSLDRRADERVERIIAANAGGRTRVAGAADRPVL
jgi:membrane fusion protein (multidrug efflux system)